MHPPARGGDVEDRRRKRRKLSELEIAARRKPRVAVPLRDAPRLGVTRLVEVSDDEHALLDDRDAVDCGILG